MIIYQKSNCFNIFVKVLKDIKVYGQKYIAIMKHFWGEMSWYIVCVMIWPK